MTKNLEPKETHNLINHIFLPPQLPQSDDECSELTFIHLACDALSEFRGHLGHPSAAVDNAITLLSKAKALHAGPKAHVDETQLRLMLRAMRYGECIPIKISAQNAGVMITHEKGQLVFKAFELSPHNKAVFATQGRLVRTFPALAVAVDPSLLQQEDFASTIANTLSTMSHQKVPEMLPRTKKAQAEHEEDRDISQPAMVTELFFGMLQGIGRSHATSAISKHTREEVLWKDARSPWRRSSMWLFLRVAMQLTLQQSSDGSHALYKNLLLIMMNRMLVSAQDLNVPAEMLYIMNAKIDRRRQKLLANNSLIGSIDTVLTRTLTLSHQAISSRWSVAQGNSIQNISMSSLESLEFEKDAFVALPGLDDYIHTIHSRQNNDGSTNFQPTSGLLECQPGEFPATPSGASDEYIGPNLQAFELWIAQNLDSWSATPGRNGTCKKLCDAIKRYHSVAETVYARNPEAISIMILTIAEMWISCDKAAIETCPLLKEYRMGFSIDVLQNLLLPLKEQMERLAKVEAYVISRSSGRASALLFDIASRESFSNRYFDSSNKHQKLLQAIEAQAERDRQAKVEEFRRANAEYARLTKLHSEATCEFQRVVIDSWVDPPQIEMRHRASCQKCSYDSQRAGISISVHEWPLPSDNRMKKTVVFELEVPEWFAYWREARLYLLNQVLKGKREPLQAKSTYLLGSNDPHLTRQYFASVQHRIGLLSQSKPVANTHYNGRDILTSSESTVCVRNGLQYKYYDSASFSYLGDFAYRDDIQVACNYKLPAEVKAIQKFLFRSAPQPDGKPPNSVIASQDDCPASMALEEYKELSTLPLGHRIQWSNVLHQLAMPSVDFKKLETNLVILQCIYQAGPRSTDGDPLRATHRVLGDRMASAILDKLETALLRIKENWESVHALNAFVAIATRVLSLNESTAEKCYSILATARAIAADWLQVLREKTFEAQDSSDRTEFALRSVEVALVCASTFDVEEEHLKTLLLRPDAFLLVWASIVIQEGQQDRTSSTPHLARQLLRTKRLLHRSYEVLAQNARAVNTAMERAWSMYAPSKIGWSLTADHWLVTEIAASSTEKVMHIHYNMLTGELLVNGLPLDQPPKDYRNDPTFGVLFRDATVEVMPPRRTGFQFSTKRAFSGWNVDLGMSAGRLIVRATNSRGSYETVPSNLLQEIYPLHFWQDHVLWYSINDGTVILRSKEDPWSIQSLPTWTLSKPEKVIQWTLTKEGVAVLALSQHTTNSIGEVLRPLATAPHTHCLLQPGSKLLHVELPSLRLSFILAKHSSDLQSREYRSMSVDSNQSLGTLIGFDSKLMLRSKTSGNRLALILESDLIYSKTSEHVLVRVATRSASKVHAVGVDESLCRLLDNHDIHCKLYLAYLHALTSYCLPDPLTLMTGTEKALAILQSKAVESFDQLSQADVDILGKLACVSPGRSYYPAHERVMQTVDWDHRLSFLSQHGNFSVIVAGLLRQSEDCKIFYPDIELRAPSMPKIKDDLRHRDGIRSSTFRIAGYGAEMHTTTHDMVYDARDQGQSCARAKRAADLSALVLRDGDALHWPIPSPDHLWNSMSSETTIHGAQLQVKASQLQYDASLLQKGLQSCIARFPALHRWLKSQQALSGHRFTIMAWLSTLAFADNVDMTLLQVISLFLKSNAMSTITAPAAETFTPASGRSFETQKLRTILEEACHSYSSCPEYNWSREINEPLNTYNSRRHTAWQRSRKNVLTQLLSSFRTQWPRKSPYTPTVANASLYLNVNDAMLKIKETFKSWWNNCLLNDFLIDIRAKVEQLPTKHINLPPLKYPESFTRKSEKGFVTEADLFLQPAPPLPPRPTLLKSHRDCNEDASAGVVREARLQNLVSRMRCDQANSSYQLAYAEDLDGSLRALTSRNAHSEDLVTLSQGDIASYLVACEAHVSDLYHILVDALSSSPSVKAASDVAQLPRMSPLLLLKQLARDRWSILCEDWRRCVLEYGLALTAYQRAQRLSSLALSNRVEDYANELRNVGHSNWNPMEHPEALLMEVESGIMIREVQEEIAREMRDPSCGRNAVMQLNMGEGKSSVIVPLVAAHHADSSQLVRVIVAKPQSKQMAQMLIARLGGLVARRVYYLPFSRSLQPSRENAEMILKLLRHCMEHGGVLLLQPEHILSFKLMVPESYLDDTRGVAKSIMASQNFLERYSRDVVDESDENFSPRFELIYTMGVQRLVDGSPDRWTLLQEVLEMTKSFSATVAEEMPGTMEIAPGVPGSFPVTRILRPEAGDVLTSKLALQICNNGVKGFPVSRQPTPLRNAVYRYITESQPAMEDINMVENGPMWTETTQPILLILRGLFAEGILAFALRDKRWRVNYGLTDRSPPTRVAVPYRAKDTPSPRSDFSHPDVVITLTLLSYYYGGLSDVELFTAFGHLEESDQADIRYQEWVKDSNRLAPAFGLLRGVNLKDRPQCISEIFPSLRFGKSVIDYYLSHIVFPKEMKEFPLKLSASGWDIGKLRQRLTTGFSGTIDSHHLLPLDVQYLELQNQRHTNALVLEHLLQPENGLEVMPAVQATSYAEHLLSFVMQMKKPVQVILDVGAQILELDNLQMAEAWLKLHDDSKEAVVFISEDDNTCVVDRSGRVEKLRSSSYQSRLDACLVFLDEAHTRGIDLVLPLHYRAAVTLGPRLTKDRLVQACMRMRKLGKGQTVVFCVSGEIQSKIIEMVPDANPAGLTVSNVLEWLMKETLADLRRNMPLWAVQGERFVRQERIWDASQDPNGDSQLSKEDAAKLLETEAQSLEERYRPGQTSTGPAILETSDDPMIQQIAERCEKFDITSFRSSALQEEQERELSPEMEQERQVQRAAPAQPATHKLHPDVETFAMRGILVNGSKGYAPAFSTLRHISAAKSFAPSELNGNGHLLATTDFAETIVKTGSSFVADTFLRSVQWIITSCESKTNIINYAMIISPFEANQLHHRMSSSTGANLHLYKARVNSGYAPLDTLDLYTIPHRNTAPALPRQLAVQLNLFAGQLCIKSYADYLEICRFLGLLPQVLTEEMEDQGWRVDAAGFILSDGEGRVGGESGLSKSPVAFLKSLITSQRNGDGIERSDIGKVLEGRIFQEKDFEE